MRTIATWGALASAMLLVACGGADEEANQSLDQTVADEVELPSTMPSPGDVTVPADGASTEQQPDAAVTPVQDPSPIPTTGEAP